MISRDPKGRLPVGSRLIVAFNENVWLTCPPAVATIRARLVACGWRNSLMPIEDAYATRSIDGVRVIAFRQSHILDSVTIDRMASR